MVKTPLAMLRRLSSCPRQIDVAERLGVRPQRVMGVESGAAVASEEFLAKLAKVLGRDPREVLLAYLETRKAFLRLEADKVTVRLTELRGPIRHGRRKSA